MINEDWLSLLIGGITSGTLVTAFFTRKSQKEKNKADNNVQLWDRTYKLIENLENQVATFKQLYATEKEENEALRNIIEEMETQISMYKKELEQYETKYKGVNE